MSEQLNSSDISRIEIALQEKIGVVVKGMETTLPAFLVLLAQTEEARTRSTSHEKKMLVPITFHPP